MAYRPDEIRRAKKLLEDNGLRESVTPRVLLDASSELKKPLREALQYVARLVAEADGAE